MLLRFLFFSLHFFRLFFRDSNIKYYFIFLVLRDGSFLIQRLHRHEREHGRLLVHGLAKQGKASNGQSTLRTCFALYIFA